MVDPTGLVLVFDFEVIKCYVSSRLYKSVPITKNNTIQEKEENKDLDPEESPVETAAEEELSFPLVMEDFQEEVMVEKEDDGVVEVKAASAAASSSEANLKANEVEEEGEISLFIFKMPRMEFFYLRNDIYIYIYICLRPHHQQCLPHLCGHLHCW